MLSRARGITSAQPIPADVELVVRGALRQPPGHDCRGHVERPAPSCLGDKRGRAEHDRDIGGRQRDNERERHVGRRGGVDHGEHLVVEAGRREPPYAAFVRWRRSPRLTT